MVRHMKWPRNIRAIAVLCCLVFICLLLSFPKESPRSDFESLFLNDKQCEASFPSLNLEIDKAVQRGPFRLEKVPHNEANSPTQGRIKNGKLYIISVDRLESQAIVRYRNAVLQQLHRAIITSPTPLPDTIFSMNINDSPRSNAWSFAHKEDSTGHRNDWLMPHFSYWSWPQPSTGPLDEVLTKIKTIESEQTWYNKTDKAIWRGTPWFNPAGTRLRQNLIKATKDKEWADVQSLKWKDPEHMENGLAIEDFCKYRFIIYTEGVTYSGRLPFHQACASVIITPPLEYLQHTSHLIKPLFSSTLNGEARPAISPTWPQAYGPEEANAVFVSLDWSDLEQTIIYLQSNPTISKGIAQRQRDLMVRKGYLSPAAEVCYWRALIRGWNKVAITNQDPIEEGGWGKWVDHGIEKGEGIRWETFSLTQKTNWN